MAVNTYYSTDASAPTLDGQAGSLVNLLKKCLVDGYGAKAAAGWTAYFDSHYQQAVFASADPDASGWWFYVNDDASLAGGGRAAEMRMWENHDGFSNDVLQVGSYFGSASALLVKSYSADATARAWTLFADGRAAWLFVDYGHPTYPNRKVPHGWGDFKSYRREDNGAAFLLATQTSQPQGARPDQVTAFGSLPLMTSGTTTAHFLARGFTGLRSAAGFSKMGEQAAVVPLSAYMGGAGQAYQPEGHNQELFVSRLRINEELPGAGTRATSYVLRGVLPGVLQPLHTRPLADKGQVSNVTGLSGRTLEGVIIPATSSTNGQVIMDVTGPWEY